jgi:hypothetical protein
VLKTDYPERLPRFPSGDGTGPPAKGPIVESHPEMFWALLAALAQRVRDAESRT